ncbi:MAG: MerR family transcriptional regulator [Alphaproteobacteria bacterium]|jgi:DNA-binding transcriptional MerR regulator|nr:MerR family transcriptional regulator [Alphaproteobacteria bacterium]
MVVNKSKAAFRTIAEVAEELGVATHVLRFWETKFPQIKPMKRNGGRRYYRPDDVKLVSIIKDYLYEKRYTIEGVQKVFKEKGVKNLLGEEIQKDFFEAETEIPELDGRSRELLTSLIDELKLAKEELSRSLAKAEE